MREGILTGKAAAYALAVLLGLGTLSPVFAAEAGETEAVDTPSPNGGTVPGAVTDWLERATDAYQPDVAKKLSVPRQAGAVADSSLQPSAASGPFRSALDGALAYVIYWIDRAYDVAGITRPDFAPASVAASIQPTVSPRS